MKRQAKNGDNTAESKGSKRQSNRAACSRCVRRKSRCDNQRPRCGPCQRASATCEYDTSHAEESRAQATRRQYEDLQVVHRATQDSLIWLRSQPADVILSCVHRLTQSMDPMHDLRAVVTELRPHIVVPQPAAEAKLIASASSTLDLWPAKHDPHVDRASPSRHEGKPLYIPNELRERVESLPLQARLSTGVGSQYTTATGKALQAESYERSLRQLEIGYWTTVPIPNKLAADLLALYFRVEHPIYAFFDPNLFLHDLLSRRVEYCSPLLVNAVLFWASCTFGPVCLGALRYTADLLDGAKRLLPSENNNSTPLNVAALIILGLGCVCYGQDKLGAQFTATGISMAEGLSLIGEGRKSIEQFADQSPENVSVMTHAAWSAFNVSTVLLLHFHDPHANTYTRNPPLLPRPRISQSTDARQIPDSFSFFCDFWCIAHQAASTLYSSPEPPHQQVPLAFAESKFLALIQWADSLPSNVKQSGHMSHNVAEMHICYHATILDLFRPFLPARVASLRSSVDPLRPEAIFMLAFDQLQDLTSYYHKTFVGTPEYHTISWFHGPMYCAPAILHYKRHLGWEQDFVACLNTCSGLFQSHQVVESFLRAVLGMAIAAGAFTLVQAVEWLDGMRAMREEVRTSEPAQAGFIVDHELAIEDRAAAVGTVLAQRFDEMLFSGDVFQPG